jgi:cysteine-rich repeat protein
MDTTPTRSAAPLATTIPSAAAAFTLGILLPVMAAAGPGSCPAGRFLVAGAPIIGGVIRPATVPAPDVLTLEGRRLSLASGCGPVRVRTRNSARGTTLRARWRSCADLPGRIRLRARIDAACNVLTGVVRAPRAAMKRRFTAVRLSTCGDGLLDAGEACDDGNAASGACCAATCCGDAADGEFIGLHDECDGTEWTGAKVLALAAPQYETTLRLRRDPATTTALTITVNYTGGAVRCIPHWNPGPGVRAPSRAAQVEVGVEISFATADGVFDERFVTALTAGENATRASFSGRLSENDLQGSYDPGLAGYENVTVGIYGSADPAETHGTVSKGGQEPGRAPSVWPFEGQWPAP